MDQVLAVLFMMGRVFVATFTSPLFILLYISLFFIVVWQYKRMGKLSEEILSSNRVIYLQSALVSALLGLIGGLLGSVLLVFVGIDLNNIGIMYLWILALGLMLINPRFLCFAYAGGILSLFSLVSGYPQINVPHLMGLVAVLHMVESILILLDGHFQPIPLYVKKKEIIQGGFNIQKFWPIPLVALIGVGIVEPVVGVAMPDWWPLLKGYSPVLQEQTYALLPIFAILGYGEICTTSQPAVRVRQSAGNLFKFSLILLLLAVAASRWDAWLFIAALFAPLGHELVIWLGMREERIKPPLYIQPEHGVMVLDIKPGSMGDKAGLRSGDIILTVNGELLNHISYLDELGRDGWGEIKLEIQREHQKIEKVMYSHPRREAGIIPVPDNYSPRYLVLEDDKIFQVFRRLWHRLRNWL